MVGLPLKVIHVVPAFFGQESDTFGGAERYVLELAKNMARRLPTMLISFGRQAHRTQIDKLEVRILRNWIHFRRFKFDPINPFLIRELMHADIIHYHQTYNMMSSMAALYARLAKKTLFTTDLGGGGYSLHRCVDTTHWYAGHLHISEFSRKSSGHETLSNARVIFGGVDTVTFSPDPDVTRTNEVLYVGRLLPHKGIDYLIQAVDSETPLRIVGRRFRHADKYFQLLKQLATGKDVSFHADYGDAEIIAAYRRALCIVLPSVYTTVFGEQHSIPELLGQTLLEGMACGTPAICTRVGSLPEVVEDGVTGFVVPPNDPKALHERITFLTDNPAAAKKLGEAARRRVSDLFTWDRTVERCLEAYGL